ncbi:hypothetical protein PITCH_A1680019 [uncultured Desulfobacterium sp.]|uniref:Uncharacterized protein n=1 Tax=uncultured Desulfobacterium sp. TaxID=201089 RepID=A0A445MUM1_9BACT|nr:hypothetical protein PITCH_A1680019 [uncultured Desulfobacterium sp.]
MAKRHIDNLFCIFDLSICKAMGLSKPILTRVIFVYDRNEKIKQIKILDKGVTESMGRRLSSWLENNIEIEDILYHIRSEEIDFDQLKNASN